MKYSLLLVTFATVVSFSADASVKASGGVAGEIETESTSVLFTVKNKSSLPVTCSAQVDYIVEVCEKGTCVLEDMVEFAKFEAIPPRASQTLTYQVNVPEGTFTRIKDKAQVSSFTCDEAPLEALPEEYIRKIRAEQAKENDRQGAKPYRNEWSGGTGSSVGGFGSW